MPFTEYSCSLRPIIEDYLKMEGKTFISKIKLPSIEAIKKCVLCGLGKSMLPHFTIKDEINRGELKEISSNGQDNAIAIYIQLFTKISGSPST